MRQRPSTSSGVSKWLAFIAIALLAGCGGGGDEDHSNHFIDTKGRLAIAESGATMLRLQDLDSGQSAATFTLNNPPSALYASPGGRYVVAVQRDSDTVQFVDGGVWQEDHGDHLHDYKANPKMVGFRIEGPRPTHYDDRHGRASIFMDGRTEPSARSSYAVLFDDTSIGRSRLLAATPPLGYSVHGFAEPNGDYLVMTHRSADAVDTLPNYLHVWQRRGDTFSKVQELQTRCDRMHGSYTRNEVTVAGCADGAALIRRGTDGSFSSRLVPTSSRVSLIAGHSKQARMLAFGNTGTPSTTRFFDIDVENARATPITIDGWSEGRLRRAHAFDRSGRQLFILDNAGHLHVLEFASGAWRVKKRLDAVIANMPTAAPFPAFAVNGAKDEAYLTDPLGKALVAIDTARLEIAGRSSLGYTPSAIAWTGITR